jgi:hypothetical protein
MGIGASISCHCMVLGIAPGSRCRSSQLECAGHSWFLNTMVSGEGRDGGGTYRVGVVRVISPDMGYVIQGLQGRNRGVEGALVIDGGGRGNRRWLGCEKRMVVTCDIAYVTHLTQIPIGTLCATHYMCSTSNNVYSVEHIDDLLGCVSFLLYSPKT